MILDTILTSVKTIFFLLAFRIFKRAFFYYSIMSDCFICKKPLGENKIRTVKAKGVKTLLDRAVAKNDEANEQFLRTISEVTVHIACYCYYVDNRTDNVVRRRSSSSSSLSSVSEAPEPDFDFVNNCFICAKAVQDPSN